MGRAITRSTRMLSERDLAIYEVFCTRCHKDLGTMDSRAILEAIALKSELMCPDCRKMMCSACDTETRDLDEDGICQFCRWEHMFDVLSGGEGRLSSISNLNKVPNGIDKNGVE